MKHAFDVEFVPEIVYRPPAMTRRERLTRWASLIRASNRPLMMFHNLEHTTLRDRQEWRVNFTCNCCVNAMGLVVKDQKFREEGELNDFSSVQDVMDYMGLTLEEVHEFSCDCNTSLTNLGQAEVVEALAHKSL
jgi:hypothetical protein